MWVERGFDGDENGELGGGLRESWRWVCEEEEEEREEVGEREEKHVWFEGKCWGKILGKLWDYIFLGCERG